MLSIYDEIISFSRFFNKLPFSCDFFFHNISLGSISWGSIFLGLISLGSKFLGLISGFKRS